jgi:hypothetical protein
MNKKNDTQKQLKAINNRMEALINRWNKQYDQNIQELLQLSTLLENLEHNNIQTNKMLLKPSKTNKFPGLF